MSFAVKSRILTDREVPKVDIEMKGNFSHRISEFAVTA